MEKNKLIWNWIFKVVLFNSDFLSLIIYLLCIFPLKRNLSDIDQDGKLTAEEFILAMHLIDVAMSGQPLPPVLPPEYIPPSFR